ncbi:MAG TPA: MFS transporter [Bryobacteraceae bacterium]|nr:MFS transporter [Bryobacteraceae bacterium]
MSTEASVLPLQNTRVRAGILGLVLFCLGHFFIDLYSSAMGAFQILLQQKLHFSLTQAGYLGGIMVFSGSFVQPAYGYLSDRFHSRMFSALAPAVAGIFIACLGLAWNFWAAAALIFLGGVGIASFHPQASARATLGIDNNRGRWMAVFISSGSLGLAVGPMYFTSITQWFGMERSYLGAIPGIIVTLLLIFWMRGPESPAPQHRKKFDFAPLRAVQKPLIILCLLVVLRSGIQIVFGQFLPLYLYRERGFSLGAAAAALSMFQIAGALGGFLGGHCTDLFGGRRVILWSMIGSVPFLALFFFGHGTASMIGLAIGGLILLFTVPVNVVMGQELAPAAAGTVSALMMGFAWGLAGLIFVPLIGVLSDRLTLHTTMSAMILFPVIAFFLTLKLPETKRI